MIYYNNTEESGKWIKNNTHLSPATLMRKIDKWVKKFDKGRDDQYSLGVYHDDKWIDDMVSIDGFPFFHAIIIDGYRWDCINRNWEECNEILPL